MKKAEASPTNLRDVEVRPRSGIKKEKNLNGFCKPRLTVSSTNGQFGTHPILVDTLLRCRRWMVQPFREVFCIDPRRWGDPAVKCGGTTSGTPSIEQPLHTAKAHSCSFLVLRLPPLLTTHQRFPPAAARPYDPLPRLLSLSLSADAPSTPRNGRNATTIHGGGRSDDKRGGVQRGRRSYRRARAAAPSAATSYCASVRQRR